MKNYWKPITALFLGGVAGLVIYNNWHHARQYIGTAVAVAITVASGGSLAWLGGMVGGLINAALNGGDLRSMLIGMAIGAAGGYIGGALGSSIAKGLSFVAEGLAATATIGAMQGAVTALIASAVYGGKVLKNMARGAFVGGVTASITHLFTPKSRGALSEEDRAYKEISRGAYDESLGLGDSLGGGTIVEIHDQSTGAPKGFRAIVVERGGERIAAFRGTRLSSLRDWGQNVRQAFGLDSEYYTFAMDLAPRLNADIFVGHSLGGGMASAAAVVTQRPAVTFNAAGLHPNTVRDFGGLSTVDRLVTAHYVRGEILASFQSLTPFPQAAGTRHPHSFQSQSNPFSLHILNAFQGVP